MSAQRNTSSLVRTSLQAALLILLFHATVTSSFKLVDCKQEKAEQGAMWCKEAFSNTFSENKLKILGSPKKKGCCLTTSLRHCVEFAFTKAKCDPKEQKMAILIRDQISDAQKSIQHGLDTITSMICGDVHPDQCDQHFLRHFNQALHNITVLNGSGTTQASLFATSLLTLIGTLYAAKWF